MQKVISLLSLALLATSAWAANTYVKVNSVDQLEVGKKYIIVNEEANCAMGEISGTNTKFGSAVDITIADGVIDIENTDVVELTLGEGNPDSFGNPTWTFEINGEGRYIIWTSGNSLNAVNGLGSTGAQWLAALTDNGVVLKNKTDNDRILEYNSSSPRFACYTTGQKPAVLYIQGAPEDDGITCLSQANALDDDELFAFNGNAVVTVFKNGYLFLRDESGYGQIKGITEGEFENGQVLNPGWGAIKTSNDGWAWYTDADGLSASAETNAALSAAQVLTSAVDESMLNAYVVVENVNKGFFPMRSLSLPDGTTIGLTDCLWASNQPATGHYNVYGIICKVDGALKFNLVDFEVYVEPEFIRGDVNGDTVVSISDVTALIDLLLSGGEIDNPAADCNLDKTVSISDVTTLIDFLLGGSWN